MTLYQRTSTLGVHWPRGVVNLMASLEEYSWGAAGYYPGIPELRGLTMHRTDPQFSTRSGIDGLSINSPTGSFTTRRR